MKKHNIGRISFVIILLNVIFMLIYLVNTHDTSFSRGDHDEVITEMTISKDETVSNEYLNIFEAIVAEKEYDREQLIVIRSHDWYFTDNIATTSTFRIQGNKITVYTDDEHFKENVTEALETIL